MASTLKVKGKVKEEKTLNAEDEFLDWILDIDFLDTRLCVSRPSRRKTK